VGEFLCMEALSIEDKKLRQEAEDFISAHQKEIIESVAGSDFPASVNPVSFFMAGSPGAGKTEFSKRLISLLKTDFGFPEIVRIDIDEIRVLLPGYQGANAYIFQKPASRMAHKIHDYVLKKKKDFVLDGTFANERIAFENISRSLKKNRGIIIVYLYQDPIKAWNFTQERERLEGRRIKKEDFIRQFFDSRKNVESVIHTFGDSISVWLAIKDYDDPSRLTLKLDVDNIAGHIKKSYTVDELEKLL